MAPKGEFCDWRVNVTNNMLVLYKSSKFQLNLEITNQTGANNRIFRRMKDIKWLGCGHLWVHIAC